MLPQNLSSIVKRRHLHPHPSPGKKKEWKPSCGAKRSSKPVKGPQNNRGKGSDSGSDDDEVLPKPSPPSQSQPKLPEGVTAPLTMVQVSNVNGSLLPTPCQL